MLCCATARENRVLRWLPRDVPPDEYQLTSFPSLSSINHQIGQLSPL
jgi:hypothetical protein